MSNISILELFLLNILEILVFGIFKIINPSSAEKGCTTEVCENTCGGVGWGGETALLVKCPLCRLEDLSSVASSHLKVEVPVTPLLGR